MGRHSGGDADKDGSDLTRRQVVLFWLALAVLNVGLAVAGFLAGIVWGLVDQAMERDAVRVPVESTVGGVR